MGFINDIVHLLRDPLTANTKQTNFSWYKKVQWSWLQGITRQMNLLCEIETVVHRDRPAAGSAFVQTGQLIGFARLPSFTNHVIVQRTFLMNEQQMSFLLLQTLTFLILWGVCSSKYESVVSLASPAQICHGTCCQNKGHEFLPCLSERGFTHGTVVRFHHSR